MLALLANKTYLKWAQKKGEENPKVAQEASRLLVCGKNEYDLVNTKQRDEGKSRFGHPKGANQREEQDVEEVGKANEQHLSIVNHSALCVESHFKGGDQTKSNSVTCSFKEAEMLPRTPGRELSAWKQRVVTFRLDKKSTMCWLKGATHQLCTSFVVCIQQLHKPIFDMYQSFLNCLKLFRF